MRTITKLGIGILAAMVLLTCAWMYHTHSLYDKSCASEYYYQVTVRMDSVLYNVTLYVPLPEGDNPDTHSGSAQMDASKQISVMLHIDHEINTKNPTGNEPMLSPKYDRTRSTYKAPYPEGWTPPECYEYKSCIYADYTASPDAEVLIAIESIGENSWWVYGWSGNAYRDRLDIRLIGEKHGGYDASGNLVIGGGRYGYR